MAEFETVIGLEIHVELQTKSKMFCGCSTTFGAPPNTQVCPVCLGHPGTLPVMNKKAVDYVVMTGQSIGSTIANMSIFHRKNYFYPDLPKGYQISQYDTPICCGGTVRIEVDGVERDIGVTRVHLEEDTGKLIHIGGKGRIAGADYSIVDYNRSGVPLMEIVSEPDMRTPEEARAYVENIKAVLEYLGVSDCSMEEGSLRCDANISLRPVGATELGTKSEIKNMNSFRSLVRALHAEIDRQTEILNDGGTIVQDTRHFDDTTGKTKSLRTKEFAHDYRYFPEPDLVPLLLEDSQIARIKELIPELPVERTARFVEMGLEKETASFLTADIKTANFFEEGSKLTKHLQELGNWMKGELSAYLNESGQNFEQSGITPAAMVELVELLKSGAISGRQAKEVFAEMVVSAGSAVTADSAEISVAANVIVKMPSQIVKEKGIEQISDEGELAAMVEQILKDNPSVVEEYKSGKEKAIGFLVGQLMKESKGKANPGLANKLIKDAIAKN